MPGYQISDHQISGHPLNLCVFCGSAAGKDRQYHRLADALGTEIARRGHKLIYGGGGLGLMGAVARAAHENGAPILGIMPEFLSHIEQSFTEAEHEIVADMPSRKRHMYDAADIFIILPGGIGTLEEAIEVLSWRRLGLHQKPIIFLSDTGYWDGLMSFFQHVIETEFTPKDFETSYHLAKSVEQVFTLIKTHKDK